MTDETTSPDSSGICPSVIDTVGYAPVVDLSRLAADLDGRILAKLEYLNPGGSKKDLIARAIIDSAEKKGLLQPGQTVLELTSGNTGNGLAMICAVRGYPFIAVMSRGNTPERAAMMQAMGATVVLVDLDDASEGITAEDMKRVENTTARLTTEHNAFRADQFNRQENAEAHYLHTGPEWLRQTGGDIDAFCDFVGTGGGFAGVARAFKEYNPAIQCFVVEPDGAAKLAGQCISCFAHVIQGGGYAKELPLLNHDHVDGHLTVKDEDVAITTRRLASEEGIFAGYSSGANVSAARQLLEGDFQGKTI
ncbi:MAG: cysteine synthase family protein, partial [Opitutales bacterium]